MKTIKRTITLLLIIGTAFVVDHCAPYDNTDDITNKQRSGMALYTDHLTGCQYLKAGFFGGITPRLDGRGNHAGCYQQ